MILQSYAYVLLYPTPVQYTLHCYVTQVSIIFLGIRDNEVDDFYQTFWKEQIKLNEVSKQGRRFHPDIIKFCILLHSKGPKSYKQLQQSGLLKLPSERTLQRYRNSNRPDEGISVEMFRKLHVDGTLDSPQNQVTVIIDEMKVKEELVYHGYTGEFVGYIDLGDEDLNELVDRNKIATNILGVYVKGIMNASISYMVCYVPSDGFKATTLYHIVLKTLSLLVNVSNLFPVALIGEF
ncbi:uncharacterized protein LOC144749304 [Ciona intestinalis]